MKTTALTSHSGITMLQIDGIQITKDMAKQLDELRFEHWENFEPFGRIRTGSWRGNPGIELIGRDKTNGALVRMWHETHPLWVNSVTVVGEDGITRRLPITDGKDETRNWLNDSYAKLPLIILPKDHRP